MRYLFQCACIFFIPLFFYWISLFISFHSNYDFIYYYDYLLFTVCQHHRVAPYFWIVRVKRLILFVPSSRLYWVDLSHFPISLLFCVYVILQYNITKWIDRVWFDVPIIYFYCLIVRFFFSSLLFSSFHHIFVGLMPVRQINPWFLVVCWITIIKIFILVL